MNILDDLTTDQLWSIMPPMVQYKGREYHFNAMRGSKREIVTYEDDDGKSLLNTYRCGDTISQALRDWLDTLIENDLLTTIQLEGLISKL